MSKFLWLFLLLAMAVHSLSAEDFLRHYAQGRFSAQGMEVNDVTGLADHIQDGKLHLHLRDFIALILKNSPDVQVTRLELYTAADQIIAAKNPFDPLLGLNFNALRSVTPISPGFFGGFGGSGGSGTGTGGSGSGTGQTGTGTGVIFPQTINALSQTSVINFSQLLPTGQVLSSNFTGTRTSGDGYAFPALFGQLQFGLTQPLLQNRTNLQFRTPLLNARTELLITSEQSEAAIGTFVAAAARQYWDAIQARDNITVQKQTLGLAQKSYEHDKLALDLGALAKLDIYQSQTQVAERNRDLIQAQFQYTVALDALRHLIGADLTPELRKTDIVLEDDASAITPRSAILPFEEALTTAMKSRPEFKAAGQRVTVDERNARAARDALLPQLNLTAQGGASGPGLNQIGAGSVLGLPANAPYPGLGDTLRQVIGFNYPSYGFGLQFSFPFHNSTAKAQLSDALVNRSRDLYQRRSTEQQIILDVRQAIDNIDLADASIAAAIRARDLAQKNVAAEQQKYELGTIAAFELLDSQTRLSSSQSAVLQTYVLYQEAFINYQRATWTLLDGFGMIVQRPSVH